MRAGPGVGSGVVIGRRCQARQTGQKRLSSLRECGKVGGARLQPRGSKNAGRMVKGINYGQMMRRALHGMIAEVLTDVARDGLPGDHHFFITFDTSHPGVDMSHSLRGRYPKDMTIVLHEWFEDLAVMRDRFSVTLSFGGIPEPIVVPFQAIQTFVDPSVEFGLRFNEGDGEVSDDSAEEDGEDGDGGDGGDGGGDLPPAPIHPSGDAEVVRLDKFRKH